MVDGGLRSGPLDPTAPGSSEGRALLTITIVVIVIVIARIALSLVDMTVGRFVGSCWC